MSSIPLGGVTFGVTHYLLNIKSLCCNGFGD
jgi:hypothetical protein